MIRIRSLDIELCHTFAGRTRGLLGRGPLSPREAIWLTPCRSVHTIGMREPLALVFISKNLAIVRIVQHAPPYRAYWCPKASSVIEMAARPAQELVAAVLQVMKLLRGLHALEDLFVGGVKASVQDAAD